VPKYLYDLLAPAIGESVVDINKLGEILGTTDMELIWGEDIELEQTGTEDSFLGTNKYEPTIESILSGLGIDPTGNEYVNNYLFYGRTSRAVLKGWEYDEDGNIIEPTGE
jgi:hypothetical protein